MRTLLILIMRDLRIEMRQRDLISVILVLGLLFGAVIASGIALTSPLRSEVLRMEPVFIWLLFVVNGTLTLERSLERDMEGGGLDALITSGVSPTLLYLARVFSLALITFIGHLSSTTGMIVLGNLAIPPLGYFVFVSGIVILAYVALATLIVPLTATSRLKGPLFALMVVPLLFPLFFAAVDLTHTLLTSRALDFSTPSFSLLVGLLTIYFTLGINLYGHALGLKSLTSLQRHPPKS